MAANEGRPTLAGGERLLNQGPAALAGALGGPAAGALLRDVRHGGPWKEPVSRQVAGALGAAARDAGLLHGSRIEIERVDAVAEEIEPAPASLAGLLERTAVAAEAGAGTVEVLEVESGGQKRWLVALPGTQAAGTVQPTANPFDESGVGEAVAAGSPFVADAVSRALREAGAGADDLVVLTGYSQGGIHAMNLAADPAFLAEHNVGFVLTAGSPVAGIAAGPDVRSVHLEHVQDWVPGADASPNPDRREQVTVTLTIPWPRPRARASGWGRATICRTTCRVPAKRMRVRIRRCRMRQRIWGRRSPVVSPGSICLRCAAPSRTVDNRPGQAHPPAAPRSRGRRVPEGAALTQRLRVKRAGYQ